MPKGVTRILGISGSPRAEGNTDILVREALRLLAEGTGAATEFLRISDYAIEPCRGCRGCMQLGHCVIAGDQFEAVMARLFAADLLVLGAPVYWLGPPGPTKDFIDRTHGYYRNHSLLRGKRALLLSVATDSGFDSHEAILRSWLQVYGAEILGAVRVFSCEKGEVLGRPEEFAKVTRLVEAALARL